MKQTQAGRRPVRLAVANQKGGVGKTTTAIHLAHGLALAGKETLLIDLDPQGNATTGLGVPKVAGGGTAALIRGGSPGRPLPRIGEGLMVCGGEAGVLMEEARLAGADGRRAFVTALDDLAAGADWVVLDCPPALGWLTRVGLHWADLVIVPIQCEFFAMEGLAQVLALTDSVRSAENPRLRLAGVLLTMFNPELPFHHEVVADLRQNLGSRVLRTVIPRDVTLAETVSHGVPIVDYDCLSCGAYAYIELTREILEHGGEATGPGA